MFGWGRRRENLLREFEEHIAIETDENIAAGMPPEEARRAARKRFGNALLAAENAREVWGWVWLERVAQDIRYAIRGLNASPAYTITLILTLALGLGFVTTMAAIVESILIKPVALPESTRLVQVYSANGAEGMTASPQALSYRTIDALRANARSLAGVGAFNTMVHPVRTGSETRVTPVVEVTPDLFGVMGLNAKLGRLINASDRDGLNVVVSEGFWRERMHSDAHVVGSTIYVAGKLRTVIGVLPAGAPVAPGMGEVVVYLPISLNAKDEDEFGIENAATIARLKPGVTRQQALADVQNVFAHVPRKNGEKERHIALRSYQQLVVGDMETPLFALLGGVAVLLLIACANAANLQIGRAANRIPEMQMRSALGASFWRLMQQMVTESILVSLLGATFGAWIAYGAVGMVRRAYGETYPRFDELAVSPTVLSVTAMLALLVGIAATLLPLLSIYRATRGSTGHAQISTKNVTHSSQLPRLLVAIQVALTCILLVVSGLFVKTMQSLENVKLGFDPHGVTTMILVPVDRTQSPTHSRQQEIELLHKFEALPGVESATMQTSLPFSAYNMTLDGTTEIVGRPFHKGENAFYSMVGTNFVKTSGIRLLQGRSFTQSDENAASVVVLVNEAFVKKYLAGRQLLQSQLHFHREEGETEADLPFAQAMTVIGVVENEVQGGDLGAPYEPMVYVNNLQLPKGSMFEQLFNMSAQYAVRSNLSQDALAAELRGVLRKDAPGMAEMSLKPMEEAVAESLEQRKLAIRLVASFGMAALVLSAVGIYGVLSYSVSRRTREIGIRMALGSTRLKAATLVMQQAGLMVGLGLLPGLAAAWCAGYLLRSYLFGVRPLDLATLIEVGVMLLAIAAAAAGIPARRAATVNPVNALRAE
ncbi:ADOP family duplicated permease [Terriglobus sp. TAA 43]|uniref:ADOP family duplicated permease n=1 Tax=Terriglobus sp. TAA 43 TaxID=278961 RepID=UPI000645C65F|nr:ADOP family duplicated permease [Terriglobus sp. TAA 43]